MSDYTLCVALTWQIAAEEAAGARQEFIEPEHLFIGLCKLVGFTQPEEIRRLGLPEAEAVPVKAEIETLLGLFSRFGLDPVTLRRELRQRKVTGILGLKIFDRPREGRIIHRSPQTRQVFTRATELARDANAPMTAVTHLLAALLDHPNLAVPSWLRRKSIDVVALKQAALAAPLPRALEAGPQSPVKTTAVLPTPRPASEASPAARVYTTHSILLAQTAPDDALAQAQRRLKIFYTIGQEFSAAASLERLLRVIVEQLSRALPQAQSGAILIPDSRGELLLHSHWPAGSPSFNLTLARRASEERHPVMWSAPLEEAGPGDPLSPSALKYPALSAMYVPLLWGDEVLGVMSVDTRQQREAFTPDDLELLSAIANQAALFLKQQLTQHALKRQEMMRQSLLNQFSPKVAELLAERGHLRIGRETIKPVTLLLANLRGFSALSATMGPDGVVQALDEIFSVFVPILSSFGGTLEKNAGETFLAVFEAKDENDNSQWERTVRAAHEIQRTVRRLEDEWQRRGWLTCDLGIGIHTGEVLAGVDAVVGNKLYPTLDELVARTAVYAEAASRGEIVLSQAAFARVYSCVDVTPKMIRAVSPDLHPDLDGYILKRLKEKDIPQEPVV